LWCRVSVWHIVIIEGRNTVEIKQNTAAFIARMNFPDPVSVSFCYPQGIIRTICYFPGKAEALIMGRDVI
jgi:hypothetical protein